MSLLMVPNGLEQMANTTTVFVIEDDQLQRTWAVDTLQSLGFSAIGFESAEVFLAKADPKASGCVLLDLQLTGMSGLQLQQELTARGLGWPVIFLTAHGEVPKAVEAMKRQAVDFLQKPIDPTRLQEVIDRAMARDSANRQQQSVLSVVRGKFEGLTPRERQVMQLVVSGYANKQIAMKLEISEKTVEVHRGHVMHKMEADSVADLVRQALLLPEMQAVAPKP